MALAIQQLEAWNVPANPINYAVSYHYVIASHDKLVTDIDAYLTVQDNLDCFFLEEIYRQYVLGQSQFRDDLVNDLGQVMDTLNQQCGDSSLSINHFLTQINDIAS